MKRYDSDFFEKNKSKQWNKEHAAGGFRCSHCKGFVVINEIMGTTNRNHCNICLWSRHVDVRTGDRRSHCNGGMKPAGLTYKQEGLGRVGELMLIHICSACNKIDINRVARDDPEDKIEALYNDSLKHPKNIKHQINNADIYLLDRSDKQTLHAQLYGSR